MARRYTREARRLQPFMAVIGGDVSQEVADDALAAHAADPAAHHTPVTVGNAGLSLSGQQLSLALAGVSGLAISGGLMLADGIAGAGLTISGKVLGIAAADTSLTVNADSLQVRLAATSGLAVSSGLMIADSIAGAGLTISGKVLAVGAGDGLTVAADTVSLTTPGSLSVSSVNAAAGNHTHAITSTSDVGTTPAASILASNATGDLQLRKLILGSSDPGDRALWIDPIQSSRVSAYGIVNTPDAGIGQTYTNYVVYYGRADVGDGTTINTISTFYVSPPTLGSGTSITVLKGVNVLDLSGAGIVQTYAYDALGTTDYNRFRGFMGVGLNLDYSYTGARLNVSDTGTQLRLLYNADIAKAARFTVDSSGYLTLDVDGNQFKLDSDVRIQSANYASQLTGWGITYSGSADFRYLYADELHVKTFIADLEQALAGGQIISKSVAILYSDFVCPAAGGNAYIYVEDLPGAPDMQVFQAGDYVGLRQFSRAGGGLTIAWCWGTVSSPNTTFDGYQGWLFTRSTAPNAGGASGTINKGTLVLDFGTSGNGYHEVNAIDGLYAVNSPYSQIVTWTTHPLNRTLRTRMGNLYGITATTEYGLYAGTGAVSNTDQYIRISDQNLDIHNIDLSIHNGTREVIRLDKDDGISVWNTAGGAVLRVYTGLTSTSWGGVTMEEGDVFLGDSSAGLYFDKSPSTVKLGDIDAGHYVYLSGSASYISMYYGGVERARYASNITLWDADGQTRLSIANDGNIQMYDPSGQVRMQLLASGNIYLYDSGGVDRLAMSTSNIRMGDSAEARVLVTPTGITFYDAASSIRGVIDGSAGSFWFGDTAATERIQWDGTNGLNIYNAAGVAVIRAPISGAAEIVGTLAVTGSITASDGNLYLGPNGLLLLSDNYDDEAVRWRTSLDVFSGRTVAHARAYTGAATFLELDAFGVDHAVTAELTAYSNYAAGVDPTAITRAYAIQGSNTSTVEHHVTDTAGTGSYYFRATRANFGQDLVVSAGLALTASATTNPSAYDIWASGGISLGVLADPGDGNVLYSGALISYKNSTQYSAYAMVPPPLRIPFTSTSWDGDARSTGTGTLTLTGWSDGTNSIPSNVKFVLVEVTIRDSATFAGTNNLGFTVGPHSSYPFCVNAKTRGGDVLEGNTAWCPVYDNAGTPTLYYDCTTSGAGTMDVWIRIWAYSL